MGGKDNSPSSSIDSSGHPSLSTSSSLSRSRKDLSTDLRLGLSLSTSSQHNDSSNARDQISDWPPIKRFLRSTLRAKVNQRQPTTFFVKVYKEGIPIGRKLDLFALDGYNGLIKALRLMFRTSIM